MPQSAKRFDELKIGDKVSVTYNNNVSVRLKPPGEAAVDTASATKTEGEGPGGTIAVVRTMTATIGAIDKSVPSITFVGPNGFKYSRRVVDPDVLDKVKVGDTAKPIAARTSDRAHGVLLPGIPSVPRFEQQILCSQFLEQRPRFLHPSSVGHLKDHVENIRITKWACFVPSKHRVDQLPRSLELTQFRLATFGV